MNQSPRIEQFGCPTCGHNIGEAAPIESVRAKIATKFQSRIFERLVMNIGEPVFLQDIENYLYADDIHGGGSNPARVINGNVVRLNEIIERYGWTIAKTKPENGKKVSFRLIPLEAMS